MIRSLHRSALVCAALLVPAALVALLDGCTTHQQTVALTALSEEQMLCVAASRAFPAEATAQRCGVAQEIATAAQELLQAYDDARGIDAGSADAGGQ